MSLVVKHLTFSDAVEVTKDVEKREVTVKACVPSEGEYSLTVFQLEPDAREAVVCYMLTTSDEYAGERAVAFCIKNYIKPRVSS